MISTRKSVVFKQLKLKIEPFTIVIKIMPSPPMLDK